MEFRSSGLDCYLSDSEIPAASEGTIDFLRRTATASNDEPMESRRLCFCNCEAKGKVIRCGRQENAKEPMRVSNNQIPGPGAGPPVRPRSNVEIRGDLQRRAALEIRKTPSDIGSTSIKFIDSFNGRYERRVKVKIDKKQQR